MKTIVPTPAREAGFFLHTLGPEVGYLDEWFDHNFFRPAPASVAVQNSDGSLYLPGGTPYGVSTAHLLPGANRPWAGRAYGGGLYIEIVVRTSAPIPAVQPWPAAALYAIEDTAPNAVTAATQWPGQPPGYGQGLEIDIFEANASSLTAYGNGGHPWCGPLGPGRLDPAHTAFPSMPTAPYAFDDRSDLNFGFRWKEAIPEIKGSGELAWYFGGQQRKAITLDPYDASLAPPPKLGSSAFSWITRRHLIPHLNAGTLAHPMLVKSVNIWQLSDSGNLIL